MAVELEEAEKTSLEEARSLSMATVRPVSMKGREGNSRSTVLRNYCMHPCMYLWTSL